MAHLLGAPKAFIPAFTLMAALLATGVISAPGGVAAQDSTRISVVSYDSSASGGVLHS